MYLECERALEHANVKAFLAVLRFTEHGKRWIDDPHVYAREFGGHVLPLETLEQDKPRNVIDKGIRSTAKGAYQFLNGTWDECKKALGISTFTPKNQDLAAVFLIRRRKGLYRLMEGDLEGCVQRCNREWASLPGSPYGQPTKGMEEVKEVFVKYGGSS